MRIGKVPKCNIFADLQRECKIGVLSGRNGSKKGEYGYSTAVYGAECGLYGTVHKTRKWNV